jgi:hypothetical protein
MKLAVFSLVANHPNAITAEARTPAACLPDLVDLAGVVEDLGFNRRPAAVTRRRHP